MDTLLETTAAANEEKELMPINVVDYIEIYTSNAKQSAYYLKSAFGFQSFAYAGLETGKKDYESFVVAQGKIRIILSAHCKVVPSWDNTSTSTVMV